MSESDEVDLREFTRTFTTDELPPIAGAHDQAHLQRVWLGTQRRAWRTLAVVPAGEGISSYEVASLITALGRYHGESVSLADLRDIRLNRVQVFLDAARELVDGGQRVVFAARSVDENLATIPLARAADAVILCVAFGRTSLSSIEETVAHIGKDRFLGSMLVDGADTGALDRLALEAPEAREARS